MEPPLTHSRWRYHFNGLTIELFWDFAFQVSTRENHRYCQREDPHIPLIPIIHACELDRAFVKVRS